MRVPNLSPLLVTPEGLALSDCEKAETLVDSLEALFQPVNDPSVPAVTEVVNEAMQTYSFAPASQPKLTNPTEVQHTIRVFKVGKAPGPNCVPNRTFNNLPLSVVSILLMLFNVIFRFQHFPSASKQAHLFSILKPGEDLALPLYYRPKSLLDMTGKLFEKILLTRILRKAAVGYCAMSSLGSYSTTPLRYISAKSLKECPRNLAKRAQHSQFFLMWLRPLILYGSTVSSANLQSLVFPHTLSKLYFPTSIVVRSKHPSK